MEGAGRDLGDTGERGSARDLHLDGHVRGTARHVVAELPGVVRAPGPDSAVRLHREREVVRRAALAREATYAKVSLHLTTRKQAEKQGAPGRFESFWGDASDILGKEAIGVLYALVILGPFAILAALAFFAERTRRRRADHRLLEETG